MRDIEIVKIDPRELKPHPLNEKIYGDEPADPEMVKSNSQIGQLDAIVIIEDAITKEKKVISGNRRNKASIELNIPVLCRVVEFEDEKEIQEAIVEFNRQREKKYFTNL